jgi:hypothetical protein
MTVVISFFFFKYAQHLLNNLKSPRLARICLISKLDFLGIMWQVVELSGLSSLVGLKIRLGFLKKFVEPVNYHSVFLKKSRRRHLACSIRQCWSNSCCNFVAVNFKLHHLMDVFLIGWLGFKGFFVFLAVPPPL